MGKILQRVAGFLKDLPKFCVLPGKRLNLPHSQFATVNIAKTRDYALNLSHEIGGAKARVFRAALGLTAVDSGWLRQRLLDAAREQQCTAGRVDRFGHRYLIDFDLTRAGRTARVRSVWIIPMGKRFARLVTCYILPSES